MAATVFPYFFPNFVFSWTLFQLLSDLTAIFETEKLFCALQGASPVPWIMPWCHGRSPQSPGCAAFAHGREHPRHRERHGSSASWGLFWGHPGAGGPPPKLPNEFAQLTSTATAHFPRRWRTVSTTPLSTARSRSKKVATPSMATTQFSRSASAGSGKTRPLAALCPKAPRSANLIVQGQRAPSPLLTSARSLLIPRPASPLRKAVATVCEKEVRRARSSEATSYEEWPRHRVKEGYENTLYPDQRLQALHQRAYGRQAAREWACLWVPTLKVLQGPRRGS